MAPYDRELDREDDEVVRESILNLEPAVTWQELSSLQFIGRKLIWTSKLDLPLVGVWELEQLDRRGWITVQDVDLESAYGDPAIYEPRGPWYSPLNNRLGDGRPDWPLIWSGFCWASDNPSCSQFRIWSRMRLTSRGWRVAQLLAPEDAPELGVFDGVAYGLQKLSAAWRQGDAEMSHWLRSGMSSASSGFEKIIGDRGRGPVRAALAELRDRFIPELHNHVDPAFRDEVRAVARAADPDAEIVDPEDGEPSTRWRCVWPQLSLESQIDELVPVLFALQARQNAASRAVDGATESSRLTTPDAPADRGEYRPGSWFEAVTSQRIPGGSLQRAAHAGRLKRSKQVGKVWHHSVEEVAGRYPEEAARIHEAIVDNSSD